MDEELTFTAAILRETGCYPSLGQVRFRGPLVDKQVLVKVLVSGICGKQLEECKGHFGVDKYLPHMLGHEGVGIVQSIGPDVTDLSVGDKVILHWLDAYSDTTTPLPLFFEDDHRINSGYLTTLAEYCVTRSNKLTKIPSEFDPQAMYVLGCGLTTGLGSVINEANVGPNDRCLIVGVGGVGLSVALGINMIRSATYDVYDIKTSSLQLASFYNPRKSYARLCDLLEAGQTYTKIFYCIGTSEIFPQIYSLLDSEGCLLMVGVPNPDATVTLPLMSIHRRKSLSGSHGGSIDPRSDIPLFAQRIHDKTLVIHPLIGPAFSLSEIDKAFAAAELQAGRVRVVCSTP